MGEDVVDRLGVQCHNDIALYSRNIVSYQFVGYGSRETLSYIHKALEAKYMSISLGPPLLHDTGFFGAHVQDVTFQPAAVWRTRHIAKARVVSTDISRGRFP